MGFDPKTGTIFAPALGMTGDLMSYVRPRWPSDYTWKGMMDYSPNGVVTAASANLAVNLSTAANVIFVSGAVTPTTHTGQLNHAWLYPTSALSQGILNKWQAIATQNASDVNVSAAAATYHLRLLDSNNQPLADTPVVPQGSGDDAFADRALFFVATLPAPAAPVARIQLLDGETVRANLAPGAAIPAVTISQPLSGIIVNADLTIEWQASDADSADELLYMIQYSPDNGAHWQTLVSDVPTLPTQSQKLKLSNANAIPASSGATALIRVLASDGYHTGLATSQLFTVLNRQPVPTIFTPSDQQSFKADAVVNLRGRAHDAEDGGLLPSALSWSIDGLAINSGSEIVAPSLAAGDHVVVLSARDSLSATATTSATLHIAPLDIPLTDAPTLNGQCDDPAYANATTVSLASYGNSEQATAQLLRSVDALWVCFSGLKQGTQPVTDTVGVLVDVDTSRHAQAQSDDLAFFVGEDGGHFTQQGDGAGGLVDGSSGLQAQVKSDTGTWQAELRIDASDVGGWDHLVGLAFGHFAVSAANDDYLWPQAAKTAKPTTWASAALGFQPQIHSLAPYTATVGSLAFTLTINGDHLVAGTTLRWAGVPVATTFISNTQLSATISSTLLSSAGTPQLTLRNPAPSNFDSAADHFLLLNGAPMITQLSPASTQAPSNSLLLTVKGSNFVNGARLLWNGELLAATFVNSTQLTVQLPPGLLTQGEVIGIVVQNPSPALALSNTAVFTVQPPPAAQQKLFLPLVTR